VEVAALIVAISAVLISIGTAIYERRDRQAQLGVLRDQFAAQVQGPRSNGSRGSLPPSPSALRASRFGYPSRTPTLSVTGSFRALPELALR
jgi:hypothetical protein